MFEGLQAHNLTASFLKVKVGFLSVKEVNGTSCLFQLNLKMSLRFFLSQQFYKYIYIYIIEI